MVNFKSFKHFWRVTYKIATLHTSVIFFHVKFETDFFFNLTELWPFLFGKRILAGFSITLKFEKLKIEKMQFL